MSGCFFLYSIFLGGGLAMDAFSVSVVNGLSEPGLHPLKAAKIALVFACFQAIMPLLGWFLAKGMLREFSRLQALIPYLSALVLCFLGVRMILGSAHREAECFSQPRLTRAGLLAQGVATSLDALSAGLAIAEYSFSHALVCALIIAAVTFVICSLGVMIGRQIGCRIAQKAEILGGLVLMALGVRTLFV